MFEAVGGFDPRHRFLEDIDLGYRLHRAGVRILLKKDLQFTHLKRYSLASLVRSDVVGRAIPWTRLMLANRIYRNDLNTRSSNVLSVVLSAVLGTMLLAEPALVMAGQGRAGFFLGGLLAAALAWLNRGFLGFLCEGKGASFALRGALMLWFGYLYSALGAAAGLWLHFVAPLRVPEYARIDSESPAGYKAKRIA